MTEYPGRYAPQPPGAPGAPDRATGGAPDQASTTAVARDQAAAVGQSAGAAGSRVAETAAGQAREVVSETARHARDLVGEASGHARDQASVQQQKAVRQLRSVADELRDMAAKGGQSGLATELAQQASERIHGLAGWLEEREPADVLQAVRDFARRRPGTFLAGAVAAGLAAGRLTRGLTDAARSGGQGASGQGASGQTASGQGAGGQGASGLGAGGQRAGVQWSGTQRPPQEIPSGATIPPPPDPDWTAPAPGYPSDAVTGTVTPGTEPYYPAGGVPGPGAAAPPDDYGETTVPDPDPGPYRPGGPS